MTKQARVLAAVMLGTTMLAACGRSDTASRTSADAVSSSNASSPSSSGPQDPCALLEPKEVEEVLGAPLAVPPFRSRDGVPASGGSSCEYEDAGMHSIRIDVEWDSGAMAFKMFGALGGIIEQRTKGMVHLADGSEIAGEWDEARVVSCCNFVALRGDQMVNVDVGASKAAIADAAKLADAALKRLDHRLAINGRSSVQAAIDYEGAHRPRRRDPCALVPRADAEAVIGALGKEPESSEDRCTYESAPKPGIGAIPQMQVYVLKVRWTGGFREYRDLNAAFAGMSKDFARNMPASAGAKDTMAAAGAGTDLPANGAWESGHANISGLSAVSRDVLVSVEPQLGSAEVAAKLMEKAMSKL
ncbi:MAG TPA: hypothetical protein VH583_10120 [Vicinamibacterales bacterium]|jgi:hypothetical protein